MSFETATPGMGYRAAVVLSAGSRHMIPGPAAGRSLE